MKLLNHLIVILFILKLSFTVMAQTPAVVLYDQVNYSGNEKRLGIGRYLLSNLNFDNKVASIKIPEGIVAVLYESGTKKEGYGISVDLLENCPDISVYKLNNKVSYIRIFKATRGNYVYSRNAIVNGRFRFGAWERKRKNPLPINHTAVVSPPIPKPSETISTTTVMSVNGPNTTIKTLGVQSSKGRTLWKKATNNQLGVIGNDFRGNIQTGSAAFERASNNIAIPDNINFWFPQKQGRSKLYFKRTLAGKVEEAHQTIIRGTFEDYDVNIYIRPFTNYRYLLTDAHKPAYTSLMASDDIKKNIEIESAGKTGCPNKFDALEAEIAEDYRPTGDDYKANLTALVETQKNKNICVFGPWIWDKGHCCHPEIHPAEQVWWSETKNNGKQYNLNVLCDASRRFFWYHQMDDGTKLKPWAEPPIKGLFAIAFSYPLPQNNLTSSSYKSLQFRVSDIEKENVRSYPNTNQTYNLISLGKNIVSFIPGNNAFRVSFEYVGINPSNPHKIRGFLVIETSVGSIQRTTYGNPNITSSGAGKLDDEEKYFKKKEGHYLFTVTEKTVSAGLLKVNIGKEKP